MHLLSYVFVNDAIDYLKADFPAPVRSSTYEDMQTIFTLPL